MVGDSRKAIVFMLLCAAATLCGCGGASNRVPVYGKVLFQDQPVAKGLIQFNPVGKEGQTPEAAPIIDGRYSLPSNRGLLPGVYKVVITATEGEEPSPTAAPGAPKRATKQPIPEEYNKQSKLSIEVTESGSREFNFEDLK